MLPLKTILLRYLFPFLLCYLGLLGLSYIPTVRASIKNIVRFQAGKTLNTMLPDAIFISDPRRIQVEEAPSQITLAYANRSAITNAVNQSGSASSDVKLLNYEVEPVFLMGLLFFLSLLLITPISWQRKGVSFLIGSVAIFLVIRYTLYVFAIQKIAKAQIGIYELTASQFSFYSTFGQVLNNANIFVVPLLIWILTAFRREDWKHLSNL